ncbi:O-antigen ligase family protein [Halolamina sediminis]|uniref:O-antigen ligase family protein n=1 Tax=Halolamina sediminis TaxID=1480675 RepID=UPI0013792835|nr:O-antigen ligase family protein [Halolamina sediminis]
MRVPEVIGYLSAIVGYILLCVFLYTTTNLSLIGDFRVMVGVMILLVSLAISVVMSPSVESVIRIVVFPLAILFNFFILPANIPRRVFFKSLSQTTALFVLIGFPAIFGGSFGPVPSYSGQSYLLGTSVSLHGLTSFFANPNPFGAIAVFGALAALWEYYSYGGNLPKVIFIINSAGVYFTQSRTAILSLVVATILFAIYRVSNRKYLLIATILGGVSAILGLSIKFKLVPGPSIIQNISLTHRSELWTAAYQAWITKPLIGWGIGNVPDSMIPYIRTSILQGYGPHNSYIRIFAASGIAGGLTYIYINIKPLLNRFRTATTCENFIEYSIVVSVLVIQVFEGNSIFGISAFSVLSAVILGYAQSSTTESSKLVP